MLLRIVYLVCALMLTVEFAVAQEDETLASGLMEDSVLPEEETEISDEELIGRYSDDPLDINTAEKEEFLAIPGMTEEVTEALLRRRSLRPFQNVTELKSLVGITPPLYSILRRCVHVKKKEVAVLSLRQRAERDIQQKKGFENAAFHGTPYTLTTRFNGKIPDMYIPTTSFSPSFRFGGLIKKDAGELARNALYRWYVEIYSPRSKVSLVLGEFTVHAGEGLLLGFPSLRTRTVGFAIPSVGARSEVQPYLSTSEEWAFHGAVASYRMRNWDVSAFLSQQKRSGTLTENSVYESILKSGLFRTTNEEQKRNVLKENIYGGVIVGKLFHHVTLGTAAYRVFYNHPLFIPSVTSDTVRETHAYSLFMKMEAEQVLLSGEIATDRKNNRATFFRGIFNFEKGWYVSASLRHYPVRFFSLYGNAPVAAGNYCSNETGANIELQIHPFPQTYAALLYDQSSSKDNTYGSVKERQQFDSKLYYLLSSACELQVRARWREEEITGKGVDSLSRSIHISDVRTTRQVKLLCTYTPSTKVLFSARMEYCNVKYQHSHLTFHGWGFSQTLGIQPVSFLSCNVRLSTFDTDSYDSRVASFEPNLPGSTSTISLYGEGLRWFWISRVMFTDGFSLSVKYSQLLKEDIDGYGTGNDRIDGTVRSRIAVQVDCRF